MKLVNCAAKAWCNPSASYSWSTVTEDMAAIGLMREKQNYNLSAFSWIEGDNGYGVMMRMDQSRRRSWYQVVYHPNCHRMLPGCWETEKEKGKGYDLSGQTGRIGQKRSSYLAACSSRFPSVASVSSNSEAQIFFVPYKLKSHEIKRFNCR